MDIFDQYGIKEVADVTLYSIHKKKDGSGEVYYVPALYFDTLKVSSTEKTADNVWAQGGLGNARLICWDYGKTINVSLEDALCTPASLGLCWGGILGSDWKDGEIKNEYGISYNHRNPVEKISRMEKAFYPRNDRENGTVSKLLPKAPYDSNRIDNDLLLQSSVVDGTKVEGFGYVSNHPYKWRLGIESKIQSIAMIPDRFYDYFGNKYMLSDEYPIVVRENVVYPDIPVKLDKDIKIDVSYTFTDEMKNEWTAIIKDYCKKNNCSSVQFQKDTEDQFVDLYPDFTLTLESFLNNRQYVSANLDSTYPRDGKVLRIQSISTSTVEEDNPTLSTFIYITAVIAADPNYYIKRQITYVMQSEDNDKINSLNGQIVLDQDKESINFFKDTVKEETYTGELVTKQEIQLIKQAHFLQIVIDNNGDYSTWIDVESSISSDAQSYDLSNCQFQQVHCINIDQFKGLDLWIRFHSINELIYCLLTKYEENIVSINSKVINLGGYNQTTKCMNSYNYEDDTSMQHQALDGKLWCYVNPRTMTPYEDDYFFHQGEPYYKKSLTLSQNNKALKAKKITVKAEQFPGMYMLVGETYIRSRETGEDERMQIKFPLCKVKSDQNLTLQADGDPTVFNLDLEIARPTSGIMMELTEYEVAAKTQVNERYGYDEQVDGSTEVLMSE